MRHITAGLGVFLLLLTGALAAPVLAQAQPPSGGAPATSADELAQTVEGAAAGYFAQDSEAAALFRDAQVEYKRILVAHLLPSEHGLIVEVELAHGASALRYPLRLKDGSADQNRSSWQVDWAPDAAYARALVSAAVDGTIARSSAGQTWAEIERLPAFPVLVGDDFFVTPYGRVEAAPAPKDTPEAAPAPTGLALPKELNNHVQRWTGMLLQDDPGSANIDILLSQGVSWERAIQVLLPAAMVGLFRVYFVSKRGEEFVASSAVAPVFKEMVSGASTLVVGVSLAEKSAKGRAYGVRLRLGGGELEVPGEAVVREDAFAASLDQILNSLEDAQTPAYVMLAASGAVDAEVVLRFLHRTRDVLELPVGKIVVGYIAPQP